MRDGSSSHNTSLRPDVTVAIVSHGHSRFVEPCLTALFANTTAALDVALVDNLGEPAIARLVLGQFPRVRLIVNERRQGFAENNNQVILHSPARFSLLLNPDTIVHPGAIDALLAHLERHPKVGACGPKLLYPDGRLQLSCRRFPTLGAVLVRRTPLRVLLRGSRVAREYMMADDTHDDCRPIDWLFGAAILIRRECLQDVGGLDESMFMYCEDVDWCLRCWQADWDIHYVPDAVITHHLDDDKYDGFFTRHRFMHYHSMWRYVRKHWRSCLLSEPVRPVPDVRRGALAPVRAADQTQALP
jgi:GT2 family glycosyltransferase